MKDTMNTPTEEPNPESVHILQHDKMFAVREDNL
jgi:hypothetical protein